MLPNEELHAEMQRLKSENYHLRNQLRNRNGECKKRRKAMQQMAKEIKQLRNRGSKQHFKNGKRGTYKNGG